MAFVIVMLMTPKVAAVPNEVPSSVETAPLMRKTVVRLQAGEMKPEASPTRRAMVPEARQEPVSIPIKPMTMTMPAVALTPFIIMGKSARRVKPLKRPYPVKTKKPKQSAKTTDTPVVAQTTMAAAKRRSAQASAMTDYRLEERR